MALSRRDITLASALLLAGAVARPALAEASGTPTPIERGPFEAEIGDRQVSFLARDLATGEIFALAGSDIETRRTPWSTFKIPNLIIALETGVASGLDHPLPWDRARRPAAGYWPDAWRQDQTLRTAFQRSAAWAFQDIASEVGSEHYQTTLRQWTYGNAEVAMGSDHFWLDHTLKISPLEQVSFMARLLSGEIPVSAASVDALRSVSFAEEMSGGRLHGKTGAGPVVAGNFSGRFEGWYVGFVTQGARERLVFALHAEGPSFRSIAKFRQQFATRLVSHLVA